MKPIMNQVLLAFRWYVAVQVFGLAALPLCLRLFRHLPDRGYGVSKPLGLLVAGWAFWLLTTFGWLHNTAGGILAVLVLLAVAGLALTINSTTRPPDHATTGPPGHLSWHTILATEAVFALAFVAWCLVRAHQPRIQTAGGEKWMEIAFLRAILRSDTFPPHDPWLSGFAISYYYFGYVIVAMLTRLAAVPPAIAFNLGIATLFALTCTGAFSLVYNLVASESKLNPKGFLKPLGFSLGLALVGPLLVAVMGNLEGLLEVLHARGVGPAAAWAWLDIDRIDEPPVPFAQGSWAPTRFFWWWQASRVLQDYTPWGAEQHVIDEFPAFSFTLGDMHPHVLALPFVLLAIALALNIYRRANLEPETFQAEPQAEALRAKPQAEAWNLKLLRRTVSLPLRPWELLTYALCLGGLGFLNTWDFPIYLFLVVAAYALAHLRITHYASRITFHASRITHHVSRFTLLFIALLLPGVLLYLPFWLGFQSQAGGILPNLFNATRLPQFLVMFGPLVFIAAAFVVGQARRSRVEAREVAKWTAAVALGILGVLAFALLLLVLLIRLGVVAPQGPAAYLEAWMRGGSIPGLEGVVDAPARISRSLLARLLNPWTALGLIALLVTIALTLIHRSTASNLQSPISNLQSSNFALLLFATGALLTLGVEYVYLRDIFGTRMNTVFKFYFQAWVLWGVAGAYALAGFIRRGRVGVVLVAALLIAAGVVYPVLAIPARAREYGGPPTLDGTAYLGEVQPDDIAAIAWLNDNVSGAPVILEAPGDGYRAYVYEGRVSAQTGLPTLLGWSGHEHQWRGNYDEQARREPDIETLYTSVDADEVLTLVDKYDISYVYVGPVERTRYPAAGLAKFAALMDAVYDSRTVTIYRRRMRRMTNVQCPMANGK
jgi:YYY domain-containing protein